MYGQTLGASSAVAGVVLLPNTGNSKTLFVVAATMLAVGVVAFVASTIQSRKQNTNQG